MYTKKNDIVKESRKHYKNRSADERQSELYKKFPPDSFLGSEINVDHFMQWVTFFRKNLHRFAMDYLGLKLHLYQIIMLFLMGINQFIVVIASRASAKSFIIALYACCRCILYPNSLIVLSSANKIGFFAGNRLVINRGVSVKSFLYRTIPRAVISNTVCNA